MTKKNRIPLSRLVLFFAGLLAFQIYLNSTLFLTWMMKNPRQEDDNVRRNKHDDFAHSAWRSGIRSSGQEDMMQSYSNSKNDMKLLTNTSWDRQQVIENDIRNRHVQSYTECMLELQDYLYPRILSWFESSVPIPFSVKIYEGHYYVLLSLYGLDKKREMPLWRTKDAKYSCNGIIGGEDLGIHWRKGRFTLIVKCPKKNGIDPNRGDDLVNLTIVPRMGGDGKGGEKDRVVYDLKKLLECEKKDIILHSNPIMGGSIKTGITVTFQGDRDRALEWATYHHILGFDHVWVYVNEPWDDGKQLPPCEYVTWIPYNHNIRHYNTSTYKKMPGHPMEQFRIASQNEALWRARRLGLDWMAFVDLDELVVLCNASQYESYGRVSGGGHDHALTGNHGGPIKDYLEQFGRMYGDAYVGIFLSSVPFGRNVQEDPNSIKELLMDYTWRENSSLYTDWWEARNKLIVNVKKVTSVNIHYTGVGGELYKPHVTELRVNHYKDKDRGVFNRQKEWLHAKGQIIEDTQLPREYRDMVLQRMKSNPRTQKDMNT